MKIGDLVKHKNMPFLGVGIVAHIGPVREVVGGAISLGKTIALVSVLWPSDFIQRKCTNRMLEVISESR